MHNITRKFLVTIVFSGALFSFSHAQAQLVEVTIAPVASEGIVSKVSAQSIIITKAAGRHQWNTCPVRQLTMWMRMGVQWKLP